MAAAAPVFEGLVVFFAGLVAMQLSSLSRGQALGLAGGLALACVVTAGLLRSRVGYVVGSVLQVAVIASGVWVTAMFFLGVVFAVLWFVALRVGHELESKRQEVAP